MGTVNHSIKMRKDCFISILILALVALSKQDQQEENREKRIFSLFNVVTFKNDACASSDSGRNGTCYTSTECQNKGGRALGNCAAGFGVCCVFIITGTGEVNQNCSYIQNPSFPSTYADTTTLTGSIGETLHGTFTTVAAAAAGSDVTNAGQCITDTFTIGSTQVPTICGTNTGDHVYFEATQECHSLDFQFGNVANGLSNIASRSWNIKVTQYSCDHPNLAPAGCTQYYYGTEATNQVRTFNWQGTRHLNSQRQIICVRREAGNCRICWSADTPSTDFELGGKAAKFNALKGEICCAYEADGKGPTGDNGYDCIIIPGAQKTDGSIINSSQCGHGEGLATAHSAAANDAKTVCSKQVPFSISFISDEFEGYYADADDGESEANAGFKLRYFQTTC